MPANIKLSKTEISKMVQSGRILGYLAPSLIDVEFRT